MHQRTSTKGRHGHELANNSFGLFRPEGTIDPKSQCFRLMWRSASTTPKTGCCCRPSPSHFTLALLEPSGARDVDNTTKTRQRKQLLTPAICIVCIRNSYDRQSPNQIQISSPDGPDEDTELRPNRDVQGHCHTSVSPHLAFGTLPACLCPDGLGESGDLLVEGVQ
jgi:hypothetical protein